MWIFSSDPSKNFVYKIGEKVPGQEDSSLWSLRKIKHKVCFFTEPLSDDMSFDNTDVNDVTHIKPSK